jgi:hypothetical protein
MWKVPSLSALFILNQLRALSQGCLNTECTVTSRPKVCSVLAIKCPITNRLIWYNYWVKWTVTCGKFSVHKFWDFCNGIPEGSTLLGYGAASMDSRILTFWGKAKSSSSRFKMYSWAYQPLKMKILCCLHMFVSSYPLMHLNIPRGTETEVECCLILCSQMGLNLHMMVLKRNVILPRVQENPHEVVQYNSKEVLIQYTGTLPTLTAFYWGKLGY